MNDFYSLLGVRREASLSEITTTYRRILKEKFEESGYNFQFSDITRAYRTLSNPEKRKEYDLLLQKVIGKYTYQNPNNLTPAEKKYQSGLNAMDQKNFQVAVDFFTQAIKIEPEKGHFYSQLGLALGMFNGRLAEAERYCKKAVELDPDNPELCYNLGFLYQRHNLVDAAQQAFLQAQQAEQKRWDRMFDQNDAAIEVPWIEEEKPAEGSKESEEAFIEEPEDTSALLAEIEDLAALGSEPPAMASIEPEVETKIIEEPQDQTDSLTIVSPVESSDLPTAPSEEETATDDMMEPIILNAKADSEISAESADIMATADIASQNREFRPAIEKQALSHIELETAEPEVADSGEQVILAEIIDGDTEAVAIMKAEVTSGFTGETSESTKLSEMQKSGTPNSDLEILPNTVSDNNEVPVNLIQNDGSEQKVHGETGSWDAPGDGDVKDTNPNYVSQDVDILKDLASLEAELAEVEASSGIGSGDNGLLMEMKTQQEIVKYSPEDSDVSDKPWLKSTEEIASEKSSLGDLEDEALNLLRELGLEPASDQMAEDAVGEQKEQAEGTDENEESSEESAEELKKIEEMEQKMAEELERLRQQRESLQKKKKK
jgi:curved DNA-binding protein CbpA